MIRKAVSIGVLAGLFVLALLPETITAQHNNAARILPFASLTVPAQAKTPAPKEVPVVTLPTEIGAKSGVFIVIQAQTDCSQVKWFSVDAGLSLLPSDLLRDSKTAIAIANSGGRFRVMAWTARGDVPSEISICTIVVDGAPPVPPPPPDVFFPTLKSAWNLETSTTKMRDKEFLASLYRSGKSVAGSCKTASEFQTKMNSAAENMSVGIPGRLLGLRRVCWAEVVRLSLPSENTPLDAGTLKNLGDALDKIATALDGLK